MPTTIKKLATAFLMGAFMISSAWAGASLLPVAHDAASDDRRRQEGKVRAKKKLRRQRDGARRRATKPTAPDAPVTIPDPSSLKDGQVLAGAAKISIEPRPQDYGGTWERSRDKCATLRENGVNQIATNTGGDGRPPRRHRLAVAREPRTASTWAASASAR